MPKYVKRSLLAVLAAGMIAGLGCGDSGGKDLKVQNASGDLKQRTGAGGAGDGGKKQTNTGAGSE